MNRATFEQWVANPDLNGLADSTRRAKVNADQGRDELIAVLSWVAYSCQEATEDVYDLVTSVWLDGTYKGPSLDRERYVAAPISPEFWSSYWQVINGPEGGYDALSITEAVASLGASVDESYGEIAEKLAQSHPGTDRPELQSIPGMLDMKKLAGCPPDSLGGELHDLLTVNGFDAEVLDREAIMLAELPLALRYLNVRILQMHDVWHLVAGYSTDAMHEVAISAFQLAQFGHNYSSMFLAAACRMAHENNPRGFNILMQTIAEAWRHGRETPSFMKINWEEVFDEPIKVIRERYDITPFSSRVPANLVETLSGGSVWQKLRVAFRVMRIEHDIRRLRAA